MSEKRFKPKYHSITYKAIDDDGNQYTVDDLCDLLNEQQDQISYWKHKVNSLLWILGQFDEEKVKKLLKEIEDE